MSDVDMRNTEFATPSGLYEFVSAPFGLISVPGAFQRFMQFVLADHIEAGPEGGANSVLRISTSLMSNW